LSKFFYRGDLSVLPGVFSDHPHPNAWPSSAPSSFTSFAAREPSHVLTEINTGWSVGWKKAGGGPSLMLDKACPLSTLQLAPRACAGGKKALSVYAVAPFLTALGTNQRIMLAERLTLLPCDDTQPTSSLFLALSVKVYIDFLIRKAGFEIIIIIIIIITRLVDAVVVEVVVREKNKCWCETPKTGVGNTGVKKPFRRYKNQLVFSCVRARLCFHFVQSASLPYPSHPIPPGAQRTSLKFCFSCH
jgi:hypothetical protein